MKEDERLLMAFLCGSPLVANGMGVKGAKAIAEALLESNRSLTALDLRCTLYWPRACDVCRLVLIGYPLPDNDLAAEGGDALLKALLHNGILTELSFAGQ
jgi:hypothetical protein